MDTHQAHVRKLQAQAMKSLERDLAAAAKANDPLRRERQFFLMLLIEARLAKGLSQAGLAARLDMRQSAIARLESGRGNPGLRTLLKIAKVLDVRLVLE